MGTFVLLWIAFSGLLLWIVLSILAGVFAGSRGRSGTGFFLVALVLSPLVSFVWAAVSPGGKKCPFCSERIKSGARICRFCGREFPRAETLPPQRGSVSVPTATEIRLRTEPDRAGEPAPSSEWKKRRTRRWPIVAIASSFLIMAILGVNHERRAVPAAGVSHPLPVPPTQFFLEPHAQRGTQGEVYITGTTDLPDGMKMWVILGRKRAQCDAFIASGKFRSGPFYASTLVTGRQPLEFTAYFNGAWQSPSVLSMVGEGGKNLHGPLFKLTDPDVVDSAKILDARFTVRLPPVPPEASAVIAVQQARLNVPGVGRSTMDVEEIIRYFTAPGTGVRPGKGWAATSTGANAYRVTYDFIDGGAGEKQAIWLVNLAGRRVTYVNKAAKMFSAPPGKVL